MSALQPGATARGLPTSHEVVAAEPSAAMRAEGQSRHPDPRIRRIADRLLALEQTFRLGLSFDFILLSAVWMHVPPANRSKTMIAEIPAPGCSGKAQKLLDPARREFVHIFGHVSKSWSWSIPPPGADLIEVTGVGFFDFEHGQNGIAPNAIELDPVLDIRRAD